MVAIIIPAYSIPRLTTTPLTMGKNNSGIVKESKEFRGTALDTGAYLRQQPSKQNKNRPECAGGVMPMSCFIDTNVPMKARTTLFGADPADRNINTFQAGYVLWRTDQQDEEDEGLLNSYIDRVTTDRKTAEPVRKSIVYFNADPGNPGANDPTKPFSRSGFQYKLPYGLSMDGSYDFFDVYALQAAPLEAVREVSVDGVDAIEFKQVVGPINLHNTLKKGLKDPQGELSPIDDISLKTTIFELPANLWDPSAGSAVTTYRLLLHGAHGSGLESYRKNFETAGHSQNFVATDDDNARSYIAADGMKKGFKDPRVTLYAVDAVSSDATVEAAVEREKSEENRLTALRAVAGVSGVLGVGLLVGGWILIVRRRKAEQSAIDAITYDDPSLSKDIGAAPYAE